MLSNIDFGSYFHTKKYEKGLSTGGDKIADWGGSKGGWGGHVPPSLYVKRGPAQRLRSFIQHEPQQSFQNLTKCSQSMAFLTSLYLTTVPLLTETSMHEYPWYSS